MESDDSIPGPGPGPDPAPGDAWCGPCSGVVRSLPPPAAASLTLRRTMAWPDPATLPDR